MYCDINKDTVPSPDSYREGACPVRWALECVSVARDGDCGKNVMCRDGLTQLKVILTDLTSGNAEDDDLALIRDICEVISTTPGCEIAERAAKNVLWSMNSYAAEWTAHTHHRCATLTCFYDVVVLPDKCTGCGKCPGICPEGAIAGGSGLISVVKAFKCTHCGECFAACPEGAVVKAGAVKPALPAAPVPVGSFAAAGGRRRRRGESGGESAPEPFAPSAQTPSSAPAPQAPAGEAAPGTPFVYTPSGERPHHVRRRHGGSSDSEE